MVQDFEKPLTISIGNIGEVDAFIPYRENFNFKLNRGDSITFDNIESSIGMYYMQQANKNLMINAMSDEVLATVTTGTYNASTDTFTAGSSDSIVMTSISSTLSGGEAIVFNVIGTIPYQPAGNPNGVLAGNRFVFKLKNKEITAKSDLPSGDIGTLINSDGDTKSFDKSAFDDDGGLVLNGTERPDSILTLSIEWEDDIISTYTFKFDKAVFAEETDEVAADVRSINLSLPVNITITNNADIAVGFVPYKENAQEFIAAGDSVELTVDTAEQAMYYIQQANSDLTVTF